MNKVYFFILCVVLLTACATPTPAPTITYSIPSISPSPPATFTATPIPPLVGCINAGHIVRIRNGPDTQSEIITRLPSGTCFAVYGFNEDRSWAWINYEGKFGWASIQYLSIKGDVSTLPVIANNVVASTFSTNSIISVITQTLNSAAETKTPMPISTITPMNTATPFIFPTANVMLCSNAPAYTNVTCKIVIAYCYYRPDVAGSPTYCDDFPYPSNRFTLLVWDSNWSDLDGQCLIVSGSVDMYAGKPQIVATSRSQVSRCP